MKLTYKHTFLVLISSILFNSCSNDESTKTDPIVTDTSTLKTFTDVTFSLDRSEGYDAGLHFSTELGKSFKTNKIDAATLPKIDISFYSKNESLNYFLSPNDADYGIPNATTSFFINAAKELMTIDQFNKIIKGTDFETIKIDNDDDDSFPDSAMPNVVLFKNAAGKKGAIYIKSVHRVGYDPRIVTDIKIQK
ncbi:hypothetical protein DOS84_03085 [Flavobacterium aquariorum]|uniref:Uncharacterized protein n=1 Tax=Flavobacterium aquariorum TaxID=2217670 RepID=A0A2W7TYW0_9FLAO|nr:hypothetical protein [Flavobacterium aquariorum]PZX94556.1 hypothetical protein DOS84_03085 [Flavobacterium aquariorum]